MRKEIQAVEWVLILAGIVLLMYGSKYIIFFARVFQGYFFLLTFGLTIWMTARYHKRYKKANIVVFPLKERDKTTRAVAFKNLQLLVIVMLSAAFYQEFWMFVPACIGYLFFIVQLNRLGVPKFVFHQSQLHRDALFFQKIDPQSIHLAQNGIIIETKGDTDMPVLFSDLDEEAFAREVEFEENQLLDDVLLTGEKDEIARIFMNEIVQFAEKKEIPLHKKQGELVYE